MRKIMQTMQTFLLTTRRLCSSNNHYKALCYSSYQYKLKTTWHCFMYCNFALEKKLVYCDKSCQFISEFVGFSDKSADNGELAIIARTNSLDRGYCDFCHRRRLRCGVFYFRSFESLTNVNLLILLSLWIIL